MPALAITKHSLRGALRRLDRTDSLAKKRFLDLLTDACSAIRGTAPASDMTELELVYLLYTNRVIVQLDMSEVFYPKWKVRITDTDTPAYRWTEDALNNLAETWNIQPSESTCRIFIEIMITSSIWYLRYPSKPQTSPLSSTPATLTPSTQTSRFPLRLKAFGEGSLKHLVHADHDFVLSGRADFAIGNGEPEHVSSPAIDSYLTLVEAKHAGTFAAAWPQMMAYIGMVHRSRVVRGKRNVTVYGICSNGMRYRFARGWKSNEFSIVSPRAYVYSYILHSLSAAELSTPYTSPTKPAEVQGKFENFEVEVESKYFHWQLARFELVENEDAEDFVIE